MFIGESLGMAARALWAHKVRSILTILGVLIGVGSVLAVVTLGASFEASIVSGFDAVGDRSILVSVGQETAGGVGGGPPDAMGLGRIFSERDVGFLAALDGVESVIVQANQPIAGFTLDGRFIPFAVLSTAPQDSTFLQTLAGGYETGRQFKPDAAEVVLSHDVAVRFGQGEAIVAGTVMEVVFLDGARENVTVAGVLSQEDNPFVQFTANTVFAPLSRYYRFPPQPSPVTGEPVLLYEGLAIVAETAEDVRDVQDAARGYLGGRDSDAQRLRVEGTEILVVTASDITDQIGVLFDQVTLFIGAIAVVSLVVGAIGIANILLVSVTERTREIGVMKAIGAKDREILVLFLLESILIGLLGSLLGIGLGFGTGAVLVNALFTDAQLAIPWGWLGISLGVGIGVGVVAGLLPALRATRVQPVVALQYE